MADISKLSFIRLNNSNWQSWSFRMQMLLIREELWHVITKPKPEEPDESDDDWDRDDQRALATIGLCLEESQYSLVKKKESAKEAWESLKAYHEKPNMSSRVSLLKRLCSVNLSEGGDMEGHLVVLDDLFERLENVGQKLDELLKVAMILRSLPNSFDSLVMALESRPDADITLDLVKSKLLDAHQRHTDRSNGKSVSEKAMKSNTKRDDEKVCFFCKRPGHYKKNCRKFLAMQKSGGSDSKPDGRSAPPKAKQVQKTSEPLCFIAGHTVKNAWIMDSGASCHMTSDKSFFTSLTERAGADVVLADGNKTKTAGSGEGVIRGVGGDGKPVDIRITDVLFVPGLDGSLLSIGKMASKGLEVRFTDDGCDIVNGSGSVVAVGVRFGNLYKLSEVEQAMQSVGVCHSEKCRHLWHRRFGHRDMDAIDKVNREKLGSGVKMTECRREEICETCLEGKLTRKPFPSVVDKKSKNILDLVHTDLCGPFDNVTPSGNRYLMSLIDDHSRFTVVYLLREKSEAKEKIKDYVSFCTNYFGRKPKIIRSDGGGEYINKDLQHFYAKEGIVAQCTTAYSPQSNGVAERKNRSLQEMASCMLLDAGMEKRYWGEAIRTAAYLQNRLPSRAVDGTPYERWYGRKPVLDHLRVFGSDAYVHIPDVKRSKLDPRSKKLTFVGYAEDRKGYRFVDRTTDTITLSRDASFVEWDNGSSQVELQSRKNWQKHQQQKSELGEDPEVSDDECSDVSENGGFKSFDEEHPIQEEQNTGEPSKQLPNRKTRGTMPIKLSDYVVGVAMRAVEEPTTFREAMESPEKNFWICAMEDEMKSHDKNGTWTLVETPPNRKIIGSRWVFKVKENEKGDIVKYKARVVAQGYAQKFGVDYDQVYAPVVSYTTLRTLLAVAGRNNFVLRHFDIKTAYLYGTLDEEVYMRQPPGFEMPGKENLVCRLWRSIYGLKQSARCWSEKLSEVLTKLGFQRSSTDQCIFFKAMSNGRKIYVLVYVDDMLVAASEQSMIDDVYRGLQQFFEISDLGNARYFLGMEVAQENGIYSISLRSYIVKMIEKFGMSDAKPSRTPMNIGYPQENSEPLQDGQLYRSLVGALLYIAVTARPDIANTVGILGRKVSSPSESDWTAAKRVLRYLKATQEWRLVLGRSQEAGKGLVAYSDADWAGDVSSRKSTTGCVIFFNGGAVDWISRKQNSVTLSSMEAEYCALSETCQELLWIRRLLKDFDEEQDQPTTVFEDNQSCLSFVSSDRLSKRSKHIETRQHFIRDLCDRRELSLEYCPTELMIADILTKPLAAIKHYRFSEMLGLTDGRVGD